MKAKTLQAILFGTYTELKYPRGRIQTLKCDEFKDGEKLEFDWRADDGLIPTLLKRIEELENKLNSLPLPPEK